MIDFDNDPESVFEPSPHRARARRARSNPSGGDAAMKGARLGGKALVGALGTLVLDRTLGRLKKADGTALLTAGQRTVALAAVAGAAALGASMVDHPLVSDALEGTALVAGGTAGIQYALQMRLPERVEGLLTGQQVPAQTAPGGYLDAPAAGLFANPMSVGVAGYLSAPSAGLFADPYYGQA